MEEELLLNGSELDALIETIASASHHGFGSHHRHQGLQAPNRNRQHRLDTTTPVARTPATQRRQEAKQAVALAPTSPVCKPLKRRREEQLEPQPKPKPLHIGFRTTPSPPSSSSSHSSSSSSGAALLPIPMPMSMLMQQHKAWRREQQEEAEQAEDDDDDEDDEDDADSSEEDKRQHRATKRAERSGDVGGAGHDGVFRRVHSQSTDEELLDDGDDKETTSSEESTSVQEEEEEENAVVLRGKRGMTRSEEMAYLQKEIRHLEAQLSRMSTTHHCNTLASSMMCTTTSTLSPHSLNAKQLQQHPSQIWRQIAANQNLGRQQAEAENEELRRQIRRHGRIVRDMQTQLARKLRNLYQCTESALSLQPRDLVRKWDDDFKRELFDLLAAQTLSMDAQLDQVFDESGLARQDLPLLNVRYVTNNSNTSSPFYAEVTKVVHWPEFDHDTSFEAMWQGFGLCEPENCSKKTLGQPEPDDLRFYTVFVPIPEQQIVNQAQTVFRRFLPDAKGRTLISWKAFGHITSLITGEKLLNMIQTGWWTIEDLMDGKHPDHRGSKLKMCVHTVPVWDTDPTSPTPKLSHETIHALLQLHIREFSSMNNEFLHNIETMIRAQARH